MSQLEEQFRLICYGWDIPDAQREYRFHDKRKWRFDFAWPEKKVAVEIEGAVWTAGRHTRGSGFVKDCDKYNAAAVLGWRVLRYTSYHLETPDDVAKQVKALLCLS